MQPKNREMDRNESQDAESVLQLSEGQSGLPSSSEIPVAQSTNLENPVGFKITSQGTEWALLSGQRGTDTALSNSGGLGADETLTSFPETMTAISEPAKTTSRFNDEAFFSTPAEHDRRLIHIPRVVNVSERNRGSSPDPLLSQPIPSFIPFFTGPTDADLPYLLGGPPPSGVVYLDGDWVELSSAYSVAYQPQHPQQATWTHGAYQHQYSQNQSRPWYAGNPNQLPYNPTPLGMPGSSSQSIGFMPRGPPPVVLQESWNLPPHQRPVRHAVSGRTPGSFPPPPSQFGKPPIASPGSITTTTSSPKTPAAKKVYNPFDSDKSDNDLSDSDDSSSSSSSSSSTKPATLPRRPDRHLFPKVVSDPLDGDCAASAAAGEWERQKRELGEKNEALDHVMAMVGIEHVKTEFLKVKATIDAARTRKGRLRRQALNLALMGNPGTGKRTLAALYRQFLSDCGVWPTASPGLIQYKARSGSSFDIDDLDKDLADCRDGMVLYIDSIECMNSDHHAKLLNVLDWHAEKVVVVLSGSSKGVMQLLGSRPHGRWEFWRRLTLKDYSDEQLRLILLKLMHHNSLKLADGEHSRYPLVAAMRVGRNRGSEGFGNVHDLILSFEKMLDRHSARMDLEREAEEEAAENIDQAQPPRSYFLTMEDILRTEPMELQIQSDAWNELEKMAGLADVKKAVGELVDRARVNHRRELAGKERLHMSLNRLFLGPPGTGKSTVAKLYGQILADYGLVSNNEVVVKTPGDFISEYIGESETNTSAILDSTIGKVLIIDDAHMFYQEEGRKSRRTDDYRLGCLDVIVSKVHNKPGEDRCVILVGYTDGIQEMLRNTNPGLRRRFPLEQAFVFTDYNDEDLNQILRLKMAGEQITASQPAMDVAAEVLRRMRDRPNFGNGGDVSNLLDQAIARFADNVTQSLENNNGDENTTLEREDFDPEWNRGQGASEKCRLLFHGLIGFEVVIDQLQGYQRMAANMRRVGRDPRQRVPFTFLFKGPPGTGKTHTGRIVGQIFYDMGFLSSNEVVECSASHLISQWVGGTAPKVVDLLDRALGKVLLIDEAYRLAVKGSRSSGGLNYEEEAVGELVDALTKPRYLHKLVIVLAGYERGIDLLMRVNPGLRGRFATEIVFRPMTPRQCKTHLVNLIHKDGIAIRDGPEANDEDQKTVLLLFSKLALTPGWANARDVETLAGIIATDIYQMEPADLKMEDDADTETPFSISTKDLIEYLNGMMRQRVRESSK
ncbi:P-loop containing nucleoside triphosphate hydrolase protein [Dactylonectria estremocensis]|uniref:P-loop containing nucleoside triphosphate hydrolase protein n=1 Tax=Dactylonectria estremocensis TaxID=1079267 RepID=A0A9P9IVU7_9HYPO|nr:P-loop containing nucleoside triphosphate hydrolase protein [Dactylonectria estremocensis]